MQAITRVNAEQTSKRAMREPTRRTDGEGRRRSSHERHGSTGPAGVRAMACVQGESTGNTGSPSGGTTTFPNRKPARDRPGRRGVADRLVVPGKPGNAGGGKGPDFGCAREATKSQGIDRKV